MARFVPAWGEAPGLKANRNVKAEGLAYSPAGIPRALAKLSIPGTVKHPLPTRAIPWRNHHPRRTKLYLGIKI